MKLVPLGLALLATTVVASAQDDVRYVDMDAGSDTNGGTTPATAWKTLTHAFDVANAGPHPGYRTLHVAPGHYVEGIETMPLLPPPGVLVVGDPNDRPVVESTSNDVFAYESPVHNYPDTTVLEGLELRPDPSSAGIRAAGIFQSMSLTFRDLVIRGGAFGIHASSGSPIVLARVEGSLIEDCDAGIDLGVKTKVFLSDSEIRTCSIGVSSTGDASLDRCVVQGCGTGIEAHEFFQDTGTNTIRDSLIVDNTGIGVDTASHGGYVVMENATVAGNDVGLFGDVTIDSSIVWGNVDDTSSPLGTSLVTASSSIVGEPVDTCLDTCLSVDPLFVDAAGGDYRLEVGSPALDAGAVGVSSLDLLGTQRPADGDLDTERRADMGAYELAPLRLTNSAGPGDSLDFEFWGAPASVSLLFATVGPLVPPLSTGYGLLELDPVLAAYLGPVSPAPGPPADVSLPVPNQPSLSGITLSFQAVTSSSAPSGGAWTTAATTTLE